MKIKHLFLLLGLLVACGINAGKKRFSGKKHGVKARIRIQNACRKNRKAKAAALARSPFVIPRKGHRLEGYDDGLEELRRTNTLTVDTANNTGCLRSMFRRLCGNRK